MYSSIVAILQFNADLVPCAEELGDYFYILGKFEDALTTFKKVSALPQSSADAEVYNKVKVYLLSKRLKRFPLFHKSS